MTTKWDAELALRVGQAVKQLRAGETPKLSATKLAERTTRLGYALTKAQISDLELGRKKTVTVPELITLALALGVPPAELLYPSLPEGEVEVWPSVKTTSATALTWFSGDIPASAVTNTPYTKSSTNVGSQLARQYEHVRRARATYMEAQLIGNAETPRGPLTTAEAEQVLTIAQERLEHLTDQFREAGRPAER